MFVLLPRVPYPIEKGDKLRAYHQLRYLSAKNDIILCALNDIRLPEGTLDALRPFCREIHVIRLSKICVAWNILKSFLSGKPLQVGYFYSSGAARKIRNLIRTTSPDHVYCQLLRVAEYVKDIPLPKTLDYQDVFSKGVERRIHTSPFYLKPVLRLEYKRLLNYEAEIFDHFDHCTIISYPDRDLIPRPDREKIVVIPNGVDLDFFSPLGLPKDYDVVFIGNMGYPPNVQAAEFLARQILPLVHQRFPRAKLALAGANPHPRVQALASDSVHVTGWVEDIRSWYARSRIFIAPMLIGTGLQNKLLEAMAMTLPCITSPLANQALGAAEGKEILVGNTAAEFAGHILHLLENPGKAEELALAGHAFVKKHFNWETAADKLEELMKQPVPTQGGIKSQQSAVNSQQSTVKS